MTVKKQSQLMSRRNVLMALGAALPLSLGAKIVFAHDTMRSDDDHPHHMGMHHGRGHMHMHGDDSDHHGHDHHHGDGDDHYQGRHHGGQSHHHDGQGKKSDGMKN